MGGMEAEDGYDEASKISRALLSRLAPKVSVLFGGADQLSQDSGVQLGQLRPLTTQGMSAAKQVTWNRVRVLLRNPRSSN